MRSTCRSTPASRAPTGRPFWTRAHHKALDLVDFGLELPKLMVLLAAAVVGLMKPATPLRVLGEGCMKPVTPLRAENGLKLAVLCEQRRQRFQTCAARSSQWCRWFHLVSVIHPHWCYRFQAGWSVGAVRWLRHPSARKNSPSRGGFWAKPRKSSPCWRKSADFGQFWRCWANFFALVWPSRG